MLRRSSAKVSIFLHTLLFLIVAASALNYWSVAEYAIKVSWDAYYYKKIGYISLVPNWQKGLKDLFAFLLLIGSLWFPATTPNQDLVKNKSLTICYALSLVILGIAIARSISSDFTLIMILSCLRPFLPLVALFVFCHRHLQSYYLRWVLEAINVLVLIQVFYAYLQRKNGLDYNGIDWLNSGAVRAVGTFIEPNTMALFLGLSFYINLSVLPPHKWRFLILLLCGIGIFFSGSRTGLSIILILGVIAFFRKIDSIYGINMFKNKLSIASLFLIMPLIFILFTVTIKNVNRISGRASSSSTSDGRIDIFQSLIDQSDILSLLFGHHLGYGSNIVQTLSVLSGKTLDESNFFLSDSTLASVLGQFGICGLLIVGSLIYILFQKMPKFMYTENPYLALVFTGNLNKDKIGFSVCLISILATIVIFESYVLLPILTSILFYFQMPDVVLERNKLY